MKGFGGEELNGQKACLACGSSIPESASLCIHCETYQDWRRHISIGNSTLALIIALLALIGPATERVWSVYKDFKNENSKKIEFSLVDISGQLAKLLVSNHSSSTIVVNNFQCIMLLPYNRDYYFNGQETLNGNVRWPKWEETIGSVLMTYETTVPLVLDEGGQAYTEFYKSHISPARSNSLKPGEEARSICSLGAINGTNSLEVDAMFLKPGDLISFDSLEIVENADYSLFQEVDRQALIKEILRVREEASHAEGEP